MHNDLFILIHKTYHYFSSIVTLINNLWKKSFTNIYYISYDKKKNL